MARSTLVTAAAVGALLLTLTGKTPATAQPPLPVEVTGATHAQYDAGSRVWLFRGAPVVVTYGPTRVAAANIRYEELQGLLAASGGVEVRHEELTLRAARAEGRLREAFVVAQGEVVVTERRQDGEARLAADRVEVQLRERVFAATGASPARSPPVNRTFPLASAVCSARLASIRSARSDPPATTSSAPPVTVTVSVLPS